MVWNEDPKRWTQRIQQVMEPKVTKPEPTCKRCTAILAPQAVVCGECGQQVGDVPTSPEYQAYLAEFPKHDPRD